MLSVEEISVYYGGIQALKGVSLMVREKEIVTVLGSNGAGKSTLLMAISGVLSSRHGKVFFDGSEITRKGPSHIVQAGISQVPEGREIFRGLSTLDNLLMGAFHHYGRSSKQSVKEDLNRIYRLFPILQQRMNQPAGTLSGGEQQMLAIGRGLMARPKLLMLDEPSLGLAPLIVEEIFRILCELNIQNIPLLLIEQNARAALKIATRGYVMETGMVTLEGGSMDLLKNPRVISAYLGR